MNSLKYTLSLCQNCGRNIGMDIEFGGNRELRAVNADGDGFTCSNRCYREYDNKRYAQIQKICAYGDGEFDKYMRGG